MKESTLAMMSFDGIRLLLPQQQVATIEMSTVIETQAEAGAAIGRLQPGPKAWPVFALDAGFGHLPQCPAHYRYCVAFDLDGRPAFALACEEVTTLALDDDFETDPLQPCMRPPHNPIEALRVRDGRLLLISSAGAMERFLRLEIAA